MDAPRECELQRAEGVSVSKCWVRSVLWIGNLHRRLLAVFLQVIGPQLSYRIMGYGARALYRLLDPMMRYEKGQNHRQSMQGLQYPTRSGRL